MSEPLWPKPVKPKAPQPAPAPTVQERLDGVGRAVQAVNATLEEARTAIQRLADQVERGVNAERQGERALSEVATTALATVQEAANALASNTEAMKSMAGILAESWGRIEVEVVGRDGRGNIKTLELRKVA